MQKDLPFIYIRRVKSFIVIPLTSRAEESTFPQNILFVPFHLLGMQQLPVRVSLVMLVNIYSKF
jgi:hypothetical protein